MCTTGLLACRFAILSYITGITMVCGEAPAVCEGAVWPPIAIVIG